ncbi:MAG: protease modulator HflK, partial [Gammaproteobacteria bacterium]|nr:protease modulator HflK [Gammaproteobacteria bacterium]
KARVIAEAEGNASRFEQLLTEYERAPAVTRERLYLETMQQVLSNTSKVLLDSEGNNSLMYLPIDKILENNSRNNAPISQLVEPPLSGSSTFQSPQNQYDRSNSRDRGAR